MISDVSALYVRKDGPYPKLVEDWWDEARDARGYYGANPVVAHPPCKRWGRFWWADGSAAPGNDGGLFACALFDVRRRGGVLEHPEGSKAFYHYGLGKPTYGKWTEVFDRENGMSEWTTSVDQGAYGHRARKRTWLLYVGHIEPPPLRWKYDPPETRVYVMSGPGISRTAESRKEHKIVLMGKRERELTPEPFAELLIELARYSRKR